MAADPELQADATPRVGLAVIAREWGRIGITGFGGPPAHIALLRKLCVERNTWLSATEFEDGIAATSLLPGPASTQLAIFCAWRLAGLFGALVGGACFIVPGLIIILALSALFLAASSPDWVTGAAAGAGAAVPAVALGAAIGLMPASWRRAEFGQVSCSWRRAAARQAAYRRRCSLADLPRRRRRRGKPGGSVPRRSPARLRSLRVAGDWPGQW